LITWELRIAPAVRRVFITENEINFLAFPPVADGLVVFGAGYGFEALAQAGWLSNCALHYWGDIDTHGFAILDQLRAHHLHAQYLLMDRQTLLQHRPQWTGELARPLLALRPPSTKGVNSSCRQGVSLSCRLTRRTRSRTSRCSVDIEVVRDRRSAVNLDNGPPE